MYGQKANLKQVNYLSYSSKETKREKNTTIQQF